MTTRNENVRVAVRCRPMSEKEIRDGHQSIVEFEGTNRIIVHDLSESPSDHLGTRSGERRNYSHVFDFNEVFDCNSSQEQVYNRSCRSIVDGCLQGYNGTIFAYGQTGTGKTYTMVGDDTSSSLMGQQKRADKLHKNKSASSNIPSLNRDESNESSSKYDDSSGIIPRAFKQIFDHIAASTNVQFLIRASYMEVYQEDIHDLLRKDRSVKLELHERPDIGVYVKDLTSFVCKSVKEIERVMRVGNQNRRVGATDMNEHSSRSHAIFMITIEQQQQQQQQQQRPSTISNNGDTDASDAREQRVIKVGKLNLVDLAGSERQRKTNSFGQRQRESIKINSSLSALGNVINSLMKLHTQGDTNNSKKQQSSGGGGGKRADSSKSTKAVNSFTPYRDSKLTRLLQDSLGGNSRTLMLANIGPASYNYDETINTLNYASRAKCIRNRPRLNEDPKDALLRELQRQIDELRSKLANMNNSNSSNNRETATTTSKQSSRRTERAPTEAAPQNVERELSELKQKLASLESRLLNGEHRIIANANILDQRLLQGYTHEQERALERNRVELASEMGRERAMRDELQRQEEAEQQAKKLFSTVQQQLAAKRKQIRKILLKAKAAREEIDSHQRAYRLELEELDQLQYELQRELKLKCLVMDNFISDHHVNHLLPRIVYDDERNECSLKPASLSVDKCFIFDRQDDLRPRGMQQRLDKNDSANDTMDQEQDEEEEEEEDAVRDVLYDAADAEQNLEALTFDDIFGSQKDRRQTSLERMSDHDYPSNIRLKLNNLLEPQLERDELISSGCDQSNMDMDLRLIQRLVDDAFRQREPDIVA